MGFNSHYETGDTELEAAQAALPAVSIPPSDLAAWRKLGDTAAARQSVSFEGVRFGGFQIPVDSGEIVVYTYRPSNEPEGTLYPFLINFNGGGYCMNNAALDHQFCCDFVLKHRLSVMNVEYRLAPEYPFPIPLEDCYSAFKWAASHDAQLRADLEKGFIVCGGSSGANLAAAVVIRARDDPSVKQKPTGQVLVSPETYSKSLHPLKEYKEQLQSFDDLSSRELFPTPEFVKMYTDAYEGKASKAELRSYKRSPLLAESLDNIPRAVIFACGKDPMRDEALLFAQRLTKANGDDRVKVHIYPSAHHGFHCVLPQVAASKKFAQDLEDGLNWLLRIP